MFYFCNIVVPWPIKGWNHTMSSKTYSGWPVSDGHGALTQPSL